MNRIAATLLAGTAGLGLAACTVNTAPPVAAAPTPVVVQEAPKPPSTVVVQPTP